MFTGIVEEAGEVVRITLGRKSTELTVTARVILSSVRTGSSVAVNGACLTVVQRRGGLLRFDVLNETIRRTNFGELKPGSLVNLERPMRADGRLDGHFVQGHVDGTGRVRRWEKVGKDYLLDVTVPRSLMKYVVEKGSVAVDGISLTVAGVRRDWFRIWIIPHTRKITNLSARRVGEAVNLEVDILAKYVEQMMRHR
jgi:riboflavin synthase